MSVPFRYIIYLKKLNVLFWWFSIGVTPDHIPNSEVKPSCADDTLYGESRLPPEQNI